MKKQSLVAIILVASVAVAFFTGSEVSRRAAAAEAKAGKVYELRTYTAAPGKLADLNARFRNHTNALFIKHGMTPIGYWTPADGPDKENVLIYILAHESRDAAKKSWGAFATDPVWTKAKKESEVNGSLTTKVESKYLDPTDYSLLK